MDAVRRVQGRLSNIRPLHTESLGLSLYALSVPVLLFPVGAPWLAIPLSLAALSWALLCFTIGEHICVHATTSAFLRSP